MDEAQTLTAIDPWFLTQVKQLVDEDEAARRAGAALLDDPAGLLRCKQLGMSDRRLMKLAGVAEEDVRQARLRHGIRPVFKRVDTCAAEFEAHTPYLYSTYETGNHAEKAAESEVAAHRQEEDRDPGRRAQPHRPGHRVRLLLRARGHGLARRGLRDPHGQLQPGDGVHRLRHR